MNINLVSESSLAIHQSIISFSRHNHRVEGFRCVDSSVEEITSPDFLEEIVGPMWIDISMPSETDIKLLTEKLDVHPLTIGTIMQGKSFSIL